MGFFKSLMRIFTWPLDPFPSKPPPPARAKKPPSKESPEVKEAARKERLMLKLRRRGQMGTTLTGPMGISEAAPVRRKVLLGE